MTRRDCLKMVGAACGLGFTATRGASPDEGKTPRLVAPDPGRDWAAQMLVKTRASLSNDGRLLATRTDSGRDEPPGAPDSDVICLWDVAGQKVVHEVRGLFHGLNLGSFSPDGSLYCLVYPTRILHPPAQAGLIRPAGPRARYVGHRQTIWDLAARQVVLDLSLDGPDSPAAPGFTEKGDELVGLSHKLQLTIRRASDGKLVLRTDGCAVDGVASTVRDIALSADARRIASLNDWVEPGDAAQFSEGDFRAWDVERRTIRRYRGGPRIEPGSPPIATLVSVAITPDGSRIITGRYDHLLTVWDFETGAVVRTFRPGGESYPSRVQVSPDGKHLLSADLEGTVRIWELETGRLIVTSIPEAETRVQSVAFPPGKLRIVSQGDFHNVYEPGTGNGPGTGRILADPKTRRVILEGTPMTIRDIDLPGDG